MNQESNLKQSLNPLKLTGMALLMASTYALANSGWQREVKAYFSSNYTALDGVFPEGDTEAYKKGNLLKVSPTAGAVRLTSTAAWWLDGGGWTSITVTIDISFLEAPNVRKAITTTICIGNLPRKWLQVIIKRHSLLNLLMNNFTMHQKMMKSPQKNLID